MQRLTPISNSFITIIKRQAYVMVLAFTAFLVGIQITLAQPPPPDDPNNVGGGTGDSGGAGVPIDGGLGILMAAGAGLGLKKAWVARLAGSGDSSEPEAS
ncbi:MAG: PID-CTERM protein-sorting domain-containing protein [Bacteroidota bacterium]